MPVVLCDGRPAVTTGRTAGASTTGCRAAIATIREVNSIRCPGCGAEAMVDESSGGNVRVLRLRDGRYYVAVAYSGESPDQLDSPHVASVSTTRWEELHTCSAGRSDSHLQQNGDAIATFTSDGDDLYERLIKREAMLHVWLDDFASRIVLAEERFDARIASDEERHAHAAHVHVVRSQHGSLSRLLDSVTDQLALLEAGPDTTDGTLG